MRDPRRCDCEAAVDPIGADAQRRRLLVALIGLPFAVSGAWALGGCSAGEEASTPSRPEGGAPAPADPRAAAPPAEPVRQQAGKAPAPGGAEHASTDALVTEIEAMKPTVQALQYVHQSTRPDQRCSNCQFYTARKSDRGTCQMYTQGLVEAGGWCTSWTKIVTTGG